MTVSLPATLLAILQTRTNDVGRHWLEEARARAGQNGTATLLESYATAAARIGRAPLSLSEAEGATLAPLANGVVFAPWTTADAARALLLAARRAQTPATFTADALACFEQGDAQEQQSWLRALCLWPEAEAFRPAAIDACRTNIIPLFEALACENPYPARHFPELHFNQMVLKALFNGIALARIAGLDGRLNADLARMAADYAAERRAARRSVPADIHRAMTGHTRQEPIA